MKPLEIYIHIPFCVKKCNYCDFLSAVSTKEERREYVRDLCRTICSHAETAKDYRVISIFIGGGTPSILEEGQIEEIFSALRKTFHIEKTAEITIEMNPGTVSRKKLRCYCDQGINRLSIGLQSVDNEELKLLGRIHTFEDFLHTYRLAREEQFRNINIDLISAIPGQTVESWRHTLRTVADLDPEHISAYSLIIEEGTLFYDLYGEEDREESDRSREESGRRSGREDSGQAAVKKLPDEESERRMYQITKQILSEYGYHRYEISNYAKQGYECRHNLGYWNRTEYLGIGRGAASLMDHARWVQGEPPEKLSQREEMEEYMFLGLRKAEGVSKNRFETEFSLPMEAVYGETIREMREKGLLEVTGDYIRLTDYGIDVSNYVMSRFLL